MGYGVADTGVDFDFVSPQQAHALLKTDKAVFVDSRDTDDFKISRIQTSYSFPANDIMFHTDKLDKTLVQRCKDLTAVGKLVVVVSDAGISGMRNRGHVSRCRHVAQYLHELGVQRDGIRRLEGGLNCWKRLGLDGVLGDTRMYFAGALMDRQRAVEVERAIAAKEQNLALEGPSDLPLPASGLTDALQPEASDDRSEFFKKFVTRLGLGPPGGFADEKAEVESRLAVMPDAAASQPTIVDVPTVYRVLKTDEVYVKRGEDPTVEKIVKVKDWATDRLVRSTGKVHQGANGGRWAQLDAGAGEEQGWVYVAGPGFGASSRLTSSEYLVT